MRLILIALFSMANVAYAGGHTGGVGAVMEELRSPDSQQIFVTTELMNAIELGSVLNGDQSSEFSTMSTIVEPETNSRVIFVRDNITGNYKVVRENSGN